MCCAWPARTERRGRGWASTGTEGGWTALNSELTRFTAVNRPQRPKCSGHDIRERKAQLLLLAFHSANRRRYGDDRRLEGSRP
jgi:hypothetical protein